MQTYFTHKPGYGTTLAPTFFVMAAHQAVGGWA